MEPFYPLHVAGLRAAACSCSSRSTWRRRRSSPSTPTSRRTPTRWVEHARDYVEAIDRAVRARRRQPRRRAREQRRLPAPALRRARHPGARHRAGRERRRGGARARRRRRSSRSSARELAARARRRGPPRRPDRRQQRARPGARPQRLRRRHRSRCSRRDGVVTIEFPHLLRLIEGNQFDTIYHEHFSYFSFLTAPTAASPRTGSRSSTSRSSPTHGGSLRVYAQRASDDDARRSSPRVARADRARAGARLRRRSRATRAFARAGRGDQVAPARVPDRAPARGQARRRLRRPGKGNTLLNYCGIRTDFLDYTVDRNPYKQGQFLPGTHIPIHAPERARARPGPTTS